jgi:ABC-type lipoprotein release transport system permease subunit
VTIAAAVAVMLATVAAALAWLVPARKAARVDPQHAMR